MTPLTLGLLAGLGALGVLAVTRSAAPTFPEPSKTARFGGYLRKGQLYRVWAKADPGYTARFRGLRPGADQQRALAADLSAWVEKSGFSPVVLATQDPSDGSVWSFIARWGLSSSEAFDQGPLRLYQIQEVDEPPQTMVPPIDPPESLDAGLLLDEISAIRYALAKDDDTRHLTGFASVLAPEFPISAGLLRAKSAILDATQSAVSIAGEGEGVRERQKRVYEAATTVVGFFEAFDWVGDAASDALDALKKATSDLGDVVRDMWDRYGGIVEVLGGWIPGPQIWAIETAYKIADSINKGEPIGDSVPEILSEQSARFAKGMQATSPFVAMIPGIGTGVAMMMNASAALALAQPLDEAALDTISMAIPGGAAAQQSFRTAATFGTAMSRGEPWDEAAVEAARKTFKDQFGDEATVAFDAGLALARGKSLQEAGFQGLYQLTKGNDLADRAAHFAEAVVKAKQEGRSVKSVLIEQMTDALDQYGRAKAIAEVQKLVDSIQKDGSLLKMFPEDLAKMMGVAPDIALAAQASVREIADGVRVVDPEVMRAINPFGASITTADKIKKEVTAINYVQALSSDPKSAYKVTGAPETVSVTQSLVSPSALKMIEATKRPEQSLVIDPSKVVDRLKQVDQAVLAGDAEAVKAKEALDRANRELERRRWVEWYRRQEELEPLPSLG